MVEALEKLVRIRIETEGEQAALWVISIVNEAIKVSAEIERNACAEIAARECEYHKVLSEPRMAALLIHNAIKARHSG